MKLRLLYLCLFILIIGCSADDDTVLGPIVNPPLDDKILSLETGHIFYDFTTIDHYGHLYITDSNGNLLKDTALVNDSNYELRSDYDYFNNSMDLTMETVFETNFSKSYYFQTFTDFKPASITRPGYLGNPNPDDLYAVIALTDIGNITSDFVLDSLIVDEVHNITCSETNQGQCELSVLLTDIPDNIYASFKSPSESVKRYIWLENLSEANTNSFTLADLPVINDYKTVNYPSGGNYLNVEIYGTLSTRPQRQHLLSKHFQDNGAEQLSHAYPKNIFDEYSSEVEFRNSDATYFSVTTDQEVESNFALPNIDFQITKYDIEDFRCQALTDYDYYIAYFKYQVVGENFSIDWLVYGKSEEEIALSMTNLSEILLEREPSFDISNFEHFYTRLYKVEEITNYADDLQAIINLHMESQKARSLEYVEKR